MKTTKEIDFYKKNASQTLTAHADPPHKLQLFIPH